MSRSFYGLISLITDQKLGEASIQVGNSLITTLTSTTNIEVIQSHVCCLSCPFLTLFSRHLVVHEVRTPSSPCHAEALYMGYGT